MQYAYYSAIRSHILRVLLSLYNDVSVESDNKITYHTFVDHLKFTFMLDRKFE